MSTTFGRGERLRANKLNRAILERGAAAGEAAAASQAAEALGFVRLSQFGIVDATGTIDMSPVIQAAFSGSVLAGKRLFIDKGTYRLNSQLNVVSGLDVLLHPGAELVGHFNTTGRNAILGMSNAAWANVQTAPLRNIKIRGGVWRRNGTVSADGLSYSGNTGNVFCIWAEDVELSDIQVTRYGPGRAFLIGGRRVFADRITIADFNHPLGLPCPGIGGTGAIRWFSGGPFTATRCVAVCGDDCFQAVPGATDNIGVDVSDVSYEDCYGLSYKGRVCVCALTIPNSLPADIQNSQTIGIRNVTFSRIRGRGKWACAVQNTDSTGLLGTVLFDDVRLGVIADLDGAKAPYAIEIIGSAATAGAGPLIFRDTELLNVLEGGIRARGSQIGGLRLINHRQPAPSNPASAFFPVHIQDCDEVIFEGGRYAAHPDSTKVGVIYLGRDDTDPETALKYVKLESVEIAGIGSGVFGINCSPDGVVSLDAIGVRMIPADGVTDARAIRFATTTAISPLVQHCDFSALGNNPFANVPASGMRQRDNRFSAAAATTNGVIHQQVAANTTIEWNGRSSLLRLTSSGPVTIETVTIPTGFPPTGTPMIFLMGVNAHTLTLSNAGNLVPVSGQTLTANQAVAFIYDWVSAKWLQIRSG
jgi:hypothetical protein